MKREEKGSGVKHSTQLFYFDNSSKMCVPFFTIMLKKNNKKILPKKQDFLFI